MIAIGLVLKWISAVVGPVAPSERVERERPKITGLGHFLAAFCFLSDPFVVAGSMTASNWSQATTTSGPNVNLVGHLASTISCVSVCVFVSICFL